MTGNPTTGSISLPLAAKFMPHEALAGPLLAALDRNSGDGAHDDGHILRVWRNIRAIAVNLTAIDLGQDEKVDDELLTAAVILHDCVAVEKNDPRRSHASRLAAARARDLMAPSQWPQERQWQPERLDALAHAIEAHSFSAGIQPQTLEAKILQDADRLDAIGAIGVARCFYVAGRMGSRLYDPADPKAERRNLDDALFAADHFPVKLLKLADGFHTAPGQRMANERTAWMVGFLETLSSEI
jgi:uncharacterized protein